MYKKQQKKNKKNWEKYLNLNVLSTVYEVLVNATGNNTHTTAQQWVHFNETKQKQEQQENTFKLKYKERKLILLEEHKRLNSSRVAKCIQKNLIQFKGSQ